MTLQYNFINTDPTTVKFCFHIVRVIFYFQKKKKLTLLTVNRPTYQKTTNVLPIITMINSLFWTLRAVFSILVCSKQATLKYGDLTYANRKSLSVLLNCSNRIWVNSELCVTFPRSIGFVDVTTASQPSETDIHESPDLASRFHIDAITH